MQCLVLDGEYRRTDAQPVFQAARAPTGSALCAEAQGFSLHAGLSCGEHQRKELEHLCRCITRPAITNERLKREGAGNVVLQLKSPWRDGATHFVMSPLEFMQRLAALVPRQRLHMIRFHGVLAPNAGLRAAVSVSRIQMSDMRAEKSQLITHSGTILIATSLAASFASNCASLLCIGML